MPYMSSKNQALEVMGTFEKMDPDMIEFLEVHWGSVLVGSTPQRNERNHCLKKNKSQARLCLFATSHPNI